MKRMQANMDMGDLIISKRGLKEELLKLIFRNNNELVINVKIKGILDCTGYEMVEVRIMKEVEQGKTEDHNTECQEGKLCPVQRPDWKNPL